MTQTTEQKLTAAEIARVFGLYLGLPDEDELRLQLTPLSQITDEDAVEVARMDWADTATHKHTIKEGRDLVTNSTEFMGWDVYQFLISKSYAVPLWFGVGHWASGKTALELGIAVERRTT